MAKKYVTEGGAQDIETTLRSAVEMLNAEPDIKKGGLYHTLEGAMQERFVKLGIMNVPEFVLLMQELGLLRHRGGGRMVVWQVICRTFFDEVVSPPWLSRAQACVAKRVEMNETLRDLRALRERVTELETTSKDVDVVGTQSLDEIADMVVRIESLETTLRVRDERIAELERELDKRSNVNHDAALAAAIKRARERTL